MSEQHEQQLGEEERLLEAIAVQRELIDAFAVDAADERAPHQRKLGQLEFKYQLLVERKRLCSVLAKLERDHGALYSEPCLLCLDNIYVHASQSLVHIFTCCGGFICTSCSKDLQKSRQTRCPLCRNPLKRENDTKWVMKLAKRGLAWAQTTLGSAISLGVDGFEKDEEGGLEWLNKAAAKNHPRALCVLSGFHRNRLVNELRKSQEETNQLLLKSANLGFARANFELAMHYFCGENGFQKDRDEAYFRASVAFALDEKDLQAASLMGTFHNEDSGRPGCSPYLECHYQNIAANKDDDGTACYVYSHALQQLIKDLHDGYEEIPGFNVIPAAFFWMRKSRDLGESMAVEQLKQWEAHVQGKCAHCSKNAQAAQVKLKQCSKCKAQWCCSKECQIKAWKAGHKKDCKRAGILNFEDYLNSE